ncbi:Geranyltranstransferase (Farnesyl-diphosphate synthase) (FPP synthase) [Candidatus Glomeribacter gigasporarum BEG34]|uniref:Geranyltranstransferase (Farnesyl-diphosphate synthase) (FPP synthase) n=1 Tax=Candidatus Glomeribacter gigasporarum BEG34 TaxID=1070319 RepID=G2J8L7_9BURK|nr:Geranyltranstransferase (Farnesyl-diphosphate synthase) (FPP synthase) [Candidatus Glomeribacter gigasporarum BEG34]
MNEMTPSFEQWRSLRLARIERALDVALPPANTRLHQVMRYAVLGNGKRIRPLLCVAAGEWAGAPDHALDAAAAALEMMHAYSLAHDDLPSMDNDRVRHGKPALHLRYDEAAAILAGDALQTQAFMTLIEGELAPLQCAALVRELATASGSAGMAGGQAMDIESAGAHPTHAALEKMARMKTGALLRAAVRMGALCAASPTENADIPPFPEALERYASAIGLAFQMVDDILDAVSDSETLGKTAGKDARDRKPNYVSILGLAASRAQVEQLRNAALAALASLPSSDQKPAHRLAQLADFIAKRAY